MNYNYKTVKFDDTQVDTPDELYCFSKLTKTQVIPLMSHTAFFNQQELQTRCPRQHD